MELLNLTSDNSIVHCPFNIVHTNKTLVIHLAKCPDRPANFKICLFNQLHILSEDKIAAHEKNCPNRLQFDNMLYTSTNQIRPKVIVQNEPVIASSLEDNSWNYPEPLTRNIIKTINERPNFMKPKYGLSKAKRKENRNELRTKYSNVDIFYNENNSIIADGQGKIKYQEKKKKIFFGKRPNK